MKIVNDINSYILSNSPDLPLQMEDFKIIRFQDHVTCNGTGDSFDYSEAHQRDFFEISIGVKEWNSLSITIGEYQFDCTDNNLIFVSPIQVIAFNIEDQEFKYTDEGYLLAFKASFLGSSKRSYEILNEFPFFHSHSLPQYILSDTQLKPIIEIVKKMFKEYSVGKEHAREILQAQLSMLLYTIKRTLDLQTQISNKNACENIAIKFEQEIINDEVKISTISEYASRLNMSSNYLSECVKKTTGKSAKQILLNHKLIIAKTLLRQSDKNISEIAEAMNFSEATNFVKFFKKMTGITPKQFRK